jgi:hypothetical protein
MFNVAKMLLLEGEAEAEEAAPGDEMPAAGTVMTQGDGTTFTF